MTKNVRRQKRQENNADFQNGEWTKKLTITKGTGKEPCRKREGRG